MYPIYKCGWKFLWVLPTHVVGIELWTFLAAYSNEYKAARLLMLIFQMKNKVSWTNFPFSFPRPADVALSSAVEFYFPTHIRCGPWLIGVMLGYIFHSTRNRKIVINKVKCLIESCATVWLQSWLSLLTFRCGCCQSGQLLRFLLDCSRFKAQRNLQVESPTLYGSLW